MPDTREMPITNCRGLHARASAKFVRLAETFQSRITVSKDDNSVGGTSIMGLMMLAACQGSSVTVTAEGADSQQALDAIEALLADKFGEGE